MNNKNGETNLFSLTKNDRWAVLILIILIAIITFLPTTSFLSKNEIATILEDTSWIKQVQNHSNNNNTNNNQFQNSAVNEFKTASNKQPVLFNFDPNTLNYEGFIQLGLRPKTAQIIINYRNKGGKFKTPDDLQKIYGLQPDEFQRLRPYIAVTALDKPVEKTFFQNTSNFSKTESEKSNQINIDINTADTTKWKMLYGIGSKLAARIVNFRTKLGGFYTIDQVGETYGVPDSTFQKIKKQLKVNADDIKKININTASFEELNAHPYINYKTAKLLVNYRTTNSGIKSLNEVELIVKETNDSFDKMKYYISLN